MAKWILALSLVLIFGCDEENSRRDPVVDTGTPEVDSGGSVADLGADGQDAGADQGTQADTGSACVDTDEDRRCDDVDNCPTVPNVGQEDDDANGVGNACQDSDGDGVTDVDELMAGTDPRDTFRCGDADGDNCDDCAVTGTPADDGPDADPSNDGVDTDGDGMCDVGDPIYRICTYNQEPRALELACPIADSVITKISFATYGSAVPAVFCSDQPPSTPVGCFVDVRERIFELCAGMSSCYTFASNTYLVEDPCPGQLKFAYVEAYCSPNGDRDDDNDGFIDFGDNCPLVANDQTDTDGNGIGDACE